MGAVDGQAKVGSDGINCLLQIVKEYICVPATSSNSAFWTWLAVQTTHEEQGGGSYKFSASCNPF